MIKNILNLRFLCRLPPWGGSGLKFDLLFEILIVPCLPPWGGSGLKLYYLEEQEYDEGLPPWGGSGLK